MGGGIRSRSRNRSLAFAERRARRVRTGMERGCFQYCTRNDTVTLRATGRSRGRGEVAKGSTNSFAAASALTRACRMRGEGEGRRVREGQGAGLKRPSGDGAEMAPVCVPGSSSGSRDGLLNGAPDHQPQPPLPRESRLPDAP